MRAIIIIPIAFICFMLTACDPYVSYTQVIENNSGHDMWVFLHGQNDKEGRFIENHKVDTLFGSGHLGTVKSYEGCKNIWNTIRDIRVDDSDSLRVGLPFNDPAIWIFSTQNNNMAGGGKCECRLVVGTPDIQ